MKRKSGYSDYQEYLEQKRQKSQTKMQEGVIRLLNKYGPEETARILLSVGIKVIISPAEIPLEDLIGEFGRESVGTLLSEMGIDIDGSDLLGMVLRAKDDK